MDCQSWGSGRNLSEISAPLALLANSAMMSTLTVYCEREDETMKKWTGNLSSYAVAKKTKSLTRHTDSCPRTSLRDCFSSPWHFRLNVVFHVLSVLRFYIWSFVWSIIACNVWSFMLASPFASSPNRSICSVEWPEERFVNVAQLNFQNLHWTYTFSLKT